MKAIILAAGYGNRMRPLTDSIHKTLLKVNNETIIDRIVNSLREYDITDIVVVTGYLADTLTQHLKEHHRDINFNFIHNDRYSVTNNIYSLSLAMNAINIDDDILLIESDLIFENHVIERIINSRYPNVALLDRFRSGMDGTVVTVSDYIITSIIPPHLQDSNFSFSDKFKTLNIYKFSKEFCLKTFRQLLAYYSRDIDENCYYELILGILIYVGKANIYAEILNGEEWSEVDDPNDLRVSEFIFNKNNRLKILEESFGGYWPHNLTDFAFIRNMYFPNPSILSELKGNLINLLQNYGSRQSVLDLKLSYFLICDPEKVFLLNGASQIYPLLKTYYSSKTVLIPTPTFGEYSRIFPNALTYGDEIGIDLVEFEKKARKADVVIFVNPNNPTGTLIPTDYIFEYASGNPDKTFIADESFIDFAQCDSVLDRLMSNPASNLIIIKSLSKSLGVPGLRVGFAYSHNDAFNEMLRESIPIWNSNSLSENFLEVILKHRDALASSYKKTIDDREEFSVALSELPIVKKVHPSAANYLLVEMKEYIDISSLVDFLLNKYSLYIKDVSSKFNNGRRYLRLAVRFPEENALLIKYFNEYAEIMKNK